MDSALNSLQNQTLTKATDKEATKEWLSGKQRSVKVGMNDQEQNN